MPGMRGIELATQARERYPDPPVLLPSGYSEEAVRGGEAEFRMISKPYGLASLSSAIGAELTLQAAA